jgi:hypothetical protein
VFFPQIGKTTAGQVRPVRSQADGSAHSEYVENVMFRKQSVMFAAVHVVGSNNDLEPWSGLPQPDSCGAPRADRLDEFQRRQAAALDWLDEVFAAATGTNGVFLMIQANPYNVSATPGCANAKGFQAFLERLEARAAAYGKPVMLANGDDHFFVLDQPFSNKLFSRVQTYGETLVHWVKIHVDPKSSGVFSVEQKIVRANLN